MKPVKHDPNCAIYRAGDIRAWCDCGAEMPVLNELRANIAERQGASSERSKIVRWLRYNANDIIGRAIIGKADVERWEGIAEAVETLADMIEEGQHDPRDD